MGISRQTFGNIIAGAHKKIADALVNGKALKISESAFAKTAGRSCFRHRKKCGQNKLLRAKTDGIHA